MLFLDWYQELMIKLVAIGLVVLKNYLSVAIFYSDVITPLVNI